MKKFGHGEPVTHQVWMETGSEKLHCCQQKLKAVPKKVNQKCPGISWLCCTQFSHIVVICIQRKKEDNFVPWVAVNFYFMGLSDSGNRVELGCVVSEI